MIKNIPSDRGQNIADIRSAIEHRAAWFYLLVEEAEKRGLDPEDFARAAIRRCGCIHGKTLFTPTSDLGSFIAQFANKNDVDIFEEEVELDGDEARVDFHFCPLVAAWQKLTGDEAKIEKLCDIAMDGDRGILTAFPDIEFTLGRTIAQGNDTCEMFFRKVKK